MRETVLVTGGSGFYGSHLCRRLAAAGHRVHLTSRRGRRESDVPGRLHVADLAMEADARRVLADAAPDLVYHLAGSASAAPRLDLVLATHHSQVTSALNLLVAATEAGVRRIVLIGSLMEPGGTVADTVPSSPYSAAKASVLHYGRMFHHLFATPVVVARPFMTFGPGQAATHVLPYVIRSLASGAAPRLSSGGWRTDWIYIDDVVDGLVLIGEREGIEGSVVDLGRGELRSVREMATRIAELMQAGVSPEFGALPDRPDEPVRMADAAATRELIGWAPATSLDDGLRRTIDWYAARV